MYIDNPEMEDLENDVKQEIECKPQINRKRRFGEIQNTVENLDIDSTVINHAVTDENNEIDSTELVLYHIF
uniref:Uncharacterized protein n=1 Tax=Panagrolaimus sp. ES5 TaxID=591445 RepID=A0AC34G2E0_9BILA